MNLTKNLVIRNAIKTTSIYISIFFLIVLSSVVIVYFDTKMSVYLLAGLFGLLMLFLQVEFLLFLLLIYSFLLLGPLNSILHFDTTWAPYLLGLALLFLSLIRLISSQTREFDYKIPSYIWALLLFISICIISTISNEPKLYLIVAASRNLFFMWGIYFVFLNGIINPNFVKRAIKFLIFAGLIQIPFSIYQRFWLVSKRNDGPVWDSVIGTFPGNGLSGDSGGMAFFLLSLCVILISLWRFKQIKGYIAFSLMILMLIPIFLAETKIVYIMLPIMACLTFKDKIRTNPLLFVMGLFLSIFLVITTFSIGQYLNYDRNVFQKGVDIEKQYDAVFGFSLESDAQEGNVLGRSTLIKYWWKNNNNDPFHLILGHGLGSTSVGTTRDKSGHLAVKYRFKSLSWTSISSLLWDTGLLGLFSYVLIYILSSIKAHRLSKIEKLSNFKKSLLTASSTILLSSLLLLPYNSVTATSMTFYMFLIGIISLYNSSED